MSKVRSSQKKVTLSELNNHTVNNKRQALKDLKMLNFDELEYIITGDLEQSDIPNHKSGLEDSIKRFAGVHGVGLASIL